LDKMTGSEILIGTQSLGTEDWMGRFYPPDLASRDRIVFYGQVFDILELNVTFYAPLSRYVEARAMSSQKDPTSAEEFASRLVDKLFLKKIPKVIRLGKSSTQLPLVASLPAGSFDKMMSRMFGLDKLKR